MLWLKPLSLVLFGLLTLFVLLSSLHLPRIFKNQAAPAVTSAQTLSFTFSAPEIVPSFLDPQYVKISMANTNSFQVVGRPTVPLKNVKVYIPAGKKLASFTVTPGSQVTLPGQYVLEPGQPQFPLLPAEELVKKGYAVSSQAPPDPSVYSQATPYPPSPYSATANIQSMAGYQIAIINLYPLRYLPASKTISYFQSLTLKVSFEPVVSPQSFTSILPADIQKIKNFVDNPALVSSPSPSSSPKKLSRLSPRSRSGAVRQQSATVDYRYLIITPGRFAAAFAPLVSHHQAQGLTARVITLEEIYQNSDYSDLRPDGQRDQQTKIRNFLIDAFQNWNTRYVLLGGDADGQNVGGETEDPVVPMRLFYSGDPSDNYNIPADIYYSNLDGTFDNNANGYYGEAVDGPAGADIDLLPELAIGRATVDTEEEVANFVAKTIDYATTSEPYLQNIYFAGEHLGFGGESEFATSTMEEIRRGSNRHGYTTAGFTYSNYYSLNTLYDDYQSTWTSYQLQDIINSGVHIINHLGHANSFSVLKLKYNPPVKDDLSELTNPHPFFLYSHGCYAGSFDNWTGDGSYSATDSIAEALTSYPHNAFAAIVNSRYGWGASDSTDGPSQRLNRQFWDAFLAENITRLGDLQNDSKVDNLWDIGNRNIRYVIYTANLLGDPAISLHQTGHRQAMASRIEFPSDVTWVPVGSTRAVPVVVTNIGSQVWIPSSIQVNYPNLSPLLQVSPVRFSSSVQSGSGGSLSLLVQASGLSPTTPTFSVQMQQGTDYFGQKYNFNPELVDYLNVTVWKRSGLPHEDGVFYYPTDITAAPNGDIYISDSGNNRIQKLTSAGAFLAKWDGHGSADGYFTNPRGIAVSPQNEVYVVDSGNNRIQKFTSDGTFLTKWGSSGSGEGQFLNPTDISIDSQGNIYISDSGNHRIQKFTSEGQFVTKWGSSGSANGQFKYPRSIAVSPQNEVYVVDSGNNRIQKFTSDGTFLTKWGSSGSGEGQLKSPSQITLDFNGDVYIVDSGNHRIQKFTSEGQFVTKWGIQGENAGQFNWPNGIDIDFRGRVYIADTSNHRLQVFDFISPSLSWNQISMQNYPGGPGPYQAYVTFTDQANYFWQNLLKGTTSYFRSVPPKGDGTPDFTRAGSWQTITTNTILAGNTSPFDAATTFKERSGTLWQNFILGNNSHFRTIPPKGDGTPDWSNASAWSVLSLGTLPLPSSGNLSYATHVDPQGTLTQILIRGQEGIYRFIPSTPEGRFNWSNPSPWHDLSENYSYYLGNLTLPIDSYDMVATGSKIIQTITKGNSSYYRYLTP
jgi:sugar lactone lactonase YvrE